MHLAARACTSLARLVHGAHVLYTMASDSGRYCRPPELKGCVVAKLVMALFPIKEIDEHSVKQLRSYEDRNYYLAGTTMKGAVEIVEEFVLKISNSLMDIEIKEGLNAITSHLHRQGFQCPQPVPTREGIVVLKMSEEQLLAGDPGAREGRRPKFCVQLLTFIPGEPLDSVSRTPRLAYEAGRYIGRMDAALQGFSHPAFDCQELGEPAWVLQHFLHLKRHLPSIEDAKRRKMVEKVIKGFERHVQPKLPLFKCGVIHGDPHWTNVIVHLRNGEYQIAGVIDFCDCSYSCCVFDLAILLTHCAMLESEDPILSTGPILCGYLAAFPLCEEEIGCLYDLILARLCQVAVLTDILLRTKQINSNTYLASIPGPAWRLMEELVNTPREEVNRIWCEARRKSAVDLDS